MSKKRNFELEAELDEQEEQRYRKPKVKRDLPRKSDQKESYERNAEVQRWLQSQTLKEDELSKSTFQPTFLMGKHDASWLLSSLTDFYEQNLITDVLHVVKSGKEATVYCCVADPRISLTYAAAKVYRPRMFRSLKNDAVYRDGRTPRDLDGNVTRNNRRERDAFKSGRGRATQISYWIDFEYQTHVLLHEGGVDTPRPLAHVGNAVLMEYIGEEGEPAPLLCNVRLTREEAHSLFEHVLHNIELCLAHNRIHGDLSEYNILYWEEKAYLIDFAQAVDPRQGTNLFPLLERDVARVCKYFSRFGVSVDAYRVAQDMWKKYQG